MTTAVDTISLRKELILQESYKILDIISSSELSHIYTCTHIQSGEIYIIKEFFPHGLTMRDLDDRTLICRLPSNKEKFQKMREAFIQEAHILQTMNHANIVSYVDHFSENNTAYLVMKYCKGQSLDHYLIHYSKMPVLRFLSDILLPIINALQYIHQQGVIHCDLKPSNILIDETGCPIILDFGSAIYYRNDTEHNIFTTKYFSPLELYSQKSKLGVYSDIYSLSAIIYYFFVGQPPLDVTDRLLEDKLQEIRKHTNEVTRLFSKLITWGLQLDYKKRCSSLALFRVAIYLEHLLIIGKKKWGHLRKKELSDTLQSIKKD